MTLGDLIQALEQHSPETYVIHGFHDPHSDRGSYKELAFAPKMGTTVGAMLTDAKSALGATYQGWKGGDFKMDTWTEVHIADRGECGPEISAVMLRCMLAESNCSCGAMADVLKGIA